jgi:hypothetical protein
MFSLKALFAVLLEEVLLLRSALLLDAYNLFQVIPEKSTDYSSPEKP